VRVAIFTDNDFDQPNGVTTALTALVEHAPEDIAPRIYTASALGADVPEYLALPSFAVPIPFCADMPLYVPRYREYLRRVLGDAVDVLHLATPGPMGVTARLVAAKTGLPLVGSLHNDLVNRTGGHSLSRLTRGLLGPYLRWMYGRCVQTLVPSQATRALFTTSTAIDHSIKLWPRGVDTALFSPTRRSSCLRERWRLGDREIVLLYVGRISRENGLDALPEILYRLRVVRLPHRMVLVGDGPDRKTLEQEAADALFTGPLSRSAVADVFGSADVFIFPSISDTPAHVVLEAQASGLPVVVSASGGSRELMLPDVTGLMCETADPKRWAEGILRLVRDPVRLRAMSQAARQYAASRSWSRALRPIYQAYRDARPGASIISPVNHAA
jgi:glycosyltransferase involved in cell wall biosynthesis